MTRRQFTGEEIASVLIDNGYYPVDRTGSHLKLRYKHPQKFETSAFRFTEKSGLERFGRSLTSAEHSISIRSASGSTGTADWYESPNCRLLPQVA